MTYHPPKSSVTIQTNPLYYALIKAVNTVGYFWLIHLTWRFITHRHDFYLAFGCVVISGCWLLLTKIKVDHLLQTYFDVLSRIEMNIPIVLGSTLSAIAILVHANIVCHYIGMAEIAGWVYMYFLYRRNQDLFEAQGYGPVPKHTWVSPPATALLPGDLILTSGRIAKALRESVGHAETVLEMPDGKMMLFSSYMDKGTRLHPLEDLTDPAYDGYYIALHLREPWDKSMQQAAAKIAETMIDTNRHWAAHENEQLEKILSILPFPESWKAKLRKIFHASGYDWFGTFMGRVVEDHWTCIGACLELYRRMGVKTNFYGTGLLGFGTTIFDPILPVRFLSDPAFELLKKDNK